MIKLGKTGNAQGEKYTNIDKNNPNVKNFRNQTNKLKEQAEGFPVDTTVNPDGSITSKFSGIRVGGEPVVGDTLSLKQRMVIKSKIKMGNKIEGIVKELYEKSGGGNFSEAEKKEIKELYGPKEGEKDPFDYFLDKKDRDIVTATVKEVLRNSIKNFFSYLYYPPFNLFYFFFINSIIAVEPSQALLGLSSTPT